MNSAMLDELERAKSAGAIRLLVLENAQDDAELTLAELTASGCDVQQTVALNREEFLAASKWNV
jgi:hypothetical protein